MTQGRRKFLTTAAATGTGAAIGGFPAIVKAQQPIKWKAQSMWSSAEITYKVFEEFCARIGKLTNGRLEIQPFAAGAVVGVFETLDAVSAGALQAHSTAPVYFTGKDAGFAVLGDLAFAYQHPWQAEAWYLYKGGLDLLREGYARFNAYVVGVSWWGLESIVSKKPIRNMADFKGIKIRSPQGINAEILAKLGGSIVVIPGGEVYSALDKGVVDAADWATISMNQRMGFHEVAKYPTMFTHSMPCQEFTVNMAAWKALPDDIKQIVTSAVREWSWDQIQRVAVDDVRVLNELTKKGVTQIYWSPEELRKVRTLAMQTWVDWSKKSPFAKKAFDSQVAWLRDLGLVA
ncbi:MAG: TRAP transporter substrate-binding protein [Betaproteobacteria bacterium]|nr:TRAP transporter substrate-binding protein [Betaproteobacteria bacterium]